MLTGTAVADPIIKPVEPGATFMFSQILGVNDNGLAVGYYGDSTLSQHGYFYNTNTGAYTFLDDPDAAFNGGVEVTQITGINNSGEITGFYSDANGVFHGFVAIPVPEPIGPAGHWRDLHAALGEEAPPDDPVDPLTGLYNPSRLIITGYVSLTPGRGAGFSRENRAVDLAFGTCPGTWPRYPADWRPSRIVLDQDRGHADSGTAVRT